MTTMSYGEVLGRGLARLPHRRTDHGEPMAHREAGEPSSGRAARHCRCRPLSLRIPNSPPTIPSSSCKVTILSRQLSIAAFVKPVTRTCSGRSARRCASSEHEDREREEVGLAGAGRSPHELHVGVEDTGEGVELAGRHRGIARELQHVAAKRRGLDDARRRPGRVGDQASEPGVSFVVEIRQLADARASSSSPCTARSSTHCCPTAGSTQVLPVLRSSRTPTVLGHFRDARERDRALLRRPHRGAVGEVVVGEPGPRAGGVVEREEVVRKVFRLKHVLLAMARRAGSERRPPSGGATRCRSRSALRPVRRGRSAYRGT